MRIPDLWWDRFPPSPGAFLEISRRVVSEEDLRTISQADYGYGAEAVLAELIAFQRGNAIPEAISGQLIEVLELTIFGATNNPTVNEDGEYGLAPALFAAALMLRLSSGPEISYPLHSEDSAMAVAVRQAGAGDFEFTRALACSLVWRLNEELHPSDENRSFVAIIGMLAALRDPTHWDERELHEFATWILELHSRQEQVWKGPFEERPPDPFSVESEFWNPVAAELRRRASRYAAPDIREAIELCAMLVEPAW